MPEYMIEIEHAPEECTQALKEMMDYDEDLIEMFIWGCRSGIHKGWALVEADNIDDVKGVMPPSVKDKVRVTEVARFAADELRRQHEQAS
jgi:hypothetical protein